MQVTIEINEWHDASRLGERGVDREETLRAVQATATCKWPDGTTASSRRRPCSE